MASSQTEPVAIEDADGAIAEHVCLVCIAVFPYSPQSKIVSNGRKARIRVVAEVPGFRGADLNA